MPLAAIELIRDLCWLIYAGAIVANSLYLMFAAKEKRQQQLDSFLNLGSVLGLSLGGAIFSAIIIRWLTIAHFYPITPVETLAFGVGFGLWLSNMILEIWTFDPLRKFNASLLKDSIPIAMILKKCQLHLHFHALLVIITHILFVQAGY